MLSDGTEDLNEGFGEGSAFRGRLLMSLKTSVDPTEMAEGKSKVVKEKLRTGVVGGVVWCEVFVCWYVLLCVGLC